MPNTSTPPTQPSPTQTTTPFHAANEIVRAHGEVKSGIQRSMFYALYCGALLQHQKEILKHGEFRPLIAQCGISKSCAHRYVHFSAEIISKCPTVGHLPTSEIVKQLPRLETNAAFLAEFHRAIAGRTLIQIAQGVDAIPGPVTQGDKAEKALAQQAEQGAPPRQAQANVYASRVWEQLSFIDLHVDYLDDTHFTQVATAAGQTLVKLGFNKQKLIEAGVPLDFQPHTVDKAAE